MRLRRMAGRNACPTGSAGMPAPPASRPTPATLTPMNETAESLMREAIALARQAASLGEVPIGCVVFDDEAGQVIGWGHNRRETDHDPTAHAEVLALREAAARRGHWRLTGCTLVVTLEP